MRNTTSFQITITPGQCELNEITNEGVKQTFLNGNVYVQTMPEKSVSAQIESAVSETLAIHFRNHPRG